MKELPLCTHPQQVLVVLQAAAGVETTALRCLNCQELSDIQIEV